MKVFIVLAVVACAIGISEGMSKEQRMEVFKGMVTDCAGKEGASSAEVDAILAHQPPSTHEGKCVGACIGTAIGTMKDNKLDIEAVVGVAKKMFDGDAAKMDLAREFATGCADITDGDRCEASFKIFECIKGAAKAKGLTSDDM